MTKNEERFPFFCLVVNSLLTCARPEPVQQLSFEYVAGLLFGELAASEGQFCTEFLASVAQQ